MTRPYLARVGAHAIGHEALEIGVDGLILLRDKEPRGNRVPGRLVEHFPEGRRGKGLLCNRDDARLAFRYVRSEETSEPAWIDVQEPGRVGNEGSPESSLRESGIDYSVLIKLIHWLIKISNNQNQTAV